MNLGKKMNMKKKSSLSRAAAVALATLTLIATHPVAGADHGREKEKHPAKGVVRIKDAFQYASDSAVTVRPTLCAPGILCVNATGGGTKNPLQRINP
jgi:hypothetical protein